MATERDTVRQDLIKLYKAKLEGCDLHIPEEDEELNHAKLSMLPCTKNPEHRNFIPIKQFRRRHLPGKYRGHLVYNWVNAVGDLTGCISSNHVSLGRLESWLGKDHPHTGKSSNSLDLFSTGTGFILYMGDRFFTEEDDALCPCGRCKKGGRQSRSRTWGKIYVVTANHVIHDKHEAEKSEMKLFFKTSESKTATVYGVKVENSDSKNDWCEVTFVTHEKDVFEKLMKRKMQFDSRYNKVSKKYKNSGDKELAVIVSHPHGGPQHVTVGRCTQVVADEWAGTTHFRYSADTCPGSSGAPVLLPGWWSAWPLWSFHHPHCRGGVTDEGKADNESADY